MGSVVLDDFETAAMSAAVNDLNGLEFQLGELERQLAEVESRKAKVEADRDAAQGKVDAFTARVLDARGLTDANAKPQRADDGSFTIITTP